MVTSLARRAAGVLVLVIFGAVAVMSLAFGLTLDGKDAPAVQCSRAAARPESGGPFSEGTVITGDRTFLPLGMTCTYDSPDDAVGPLAVGHPNWPATVTWLASSAIAVFGLALAVRPRREGRRPDSRFLSPLD